MSSKITCLLSASHLYFFFFNDTATTEIYTLSLHDALPISPPSRHGSRTRISRSARRPELVRSEEHTSELQSPDQLVCRLLLEKKKPEITTSKNKKKKKKKSRQNTKTN